MDKSMVPQPENELILRNLDVLSSRGATDQEFVTSIELLNEISADIARDESLRELIGQSFPSIWEKLQGIWDDMSASDDDTLRGNPQRDLILAIARLTRNILAGNSYNQEKLKCEPAIRRLAHKYTSFFFSQDPESFSVIRFLMQTLSNLVTSNESLTERLWAFYMSLPEEQNIILRVLPQPDNGTVTAAIVFISNCISGSRKRMRLLAETRTGCRVCVVLLDILAKQVEIHEDGDAAENFEIGWNIFKTLFDNGFAPSLFPNLDMEGQIVTPYQTTLLKVLDAYLLQSPSPRQPLEQTSVGECDAISQLVTLFSVKFLELAKNAQSSIKQSLGSSRSPVVDCDAYSDMGIQNAENTAPLQSLDVLLPKVCEAIVLVTQCFCTLSLAQSDTGLLSQRAQWTREFLTDAESPLGGGLIENLIELLRVLDAFLPRIMFGKISWSTPRPATPLAPNQPEINITGFNYLKRDLVRLLGILCYENRAVQDRVRVCDGITVVMNLCVADERNPYLREHALFSLRNLLHENVENQAVVDAIKPMGIWDDNGVLRDVPGVRK
ncbi:spinocerebellar ataxia type 10 protein domain-containing protein [Phellopilus nigrolimitatus]|nr:spinocerebellar ataxia type 10 protein domain-containing protein [Phellopilus nigrolimitatus]